VNLGNIYYLRKDMERALEYYGRAYEREPDNARIILALSRVYRELQDYELSGRMFAKLKAVDIELAEAFSWLEIAGTGNDRASQAGNLHEKMIWEE